MVQSRHLRHIHQSRTHGRFHGKAPVTYELVWGLGFGVLGFWGSVFRDQDLQGVVYGGMGIKKYKYKYKYIYIYIVSGMLLSRIGSLLNPKP